MSTANPKAILVTANPDALLPGETAIQKRLVDLRYDVVAISPDKIQEFDIREIMLMVVSSSVVDEAFGETLRDLVVPIIVSSKEFYLNLGMCRTTEAGEENSKSIEIIQPPNPGHPMTADLSGTIKISPDSEPMKLSWANYSAEGEFEKRVSIAAIPVTPSAGRKPFFWKRSASARTATEPSKNVLFGCRVATTMFAEGSQPAKDFPEKRVAFPLDYRRQPGAKLLSLFDEAAKWAVGDINIRQFAEVFRDEWREIYTRRKSAYARPPQPDVTGFDGKHAPENLVGLAFSGGGIRSATFCLGVLQGLHELKLLRLFDYFSTVSGGGYLGGWWSAWLSRPGKDETYGIFPDAEKIEPARLDHYRWRSKSTRVAEGSLSAWHDPIHHLRLFANYLTPRTGGFSADTWRAIAIISRNLLLTWLMLLPLLLTFVIAAQTLFMLYPNAEFLHRHWIDLQQTVPESQPNQYRQILAQRALIIALILLPFIGWIGLMFITFMRSNSAIPLLVKLKDRWFSSDGNFKWALEGSFLAILWGPLA